MKNLKSIIAIITFSFLVITSCKEETTKQVDEGKSMIDKSEIINQEEINLNETSDKKKDEDITNIKSNEATFVVKANKALEYKFKIDQYEKLEYNWKSDAPLHYDFHGDPEAKEKYPEGYFESYAIGNSDYAKGKVTIPYKGSHGWYWKNESGKDITITLTTKGNYTIVGLIQ